MGKRNKMLPALRKTSALSEYQESETEEETEEKPILDAELSTLSPQEEFKETITEGVKAGIIEGIKETSEEEPLEPFLNHKEAYVAKSDGKVVLAFICDEFSPKIRGKIFQILGECNLSVNLENAGIAAKLFKKQTRAKTLFDTK